MIRIYGHPGDGIEFIPVRHRSGDAGLRYPVELNLHNDAAVETGELGLKDKARLSLIAAAPLDHGAPHLRSAVEPAAAGGATRTSLPR